MTTDGKREIVLSARLTIRAPYGPNEWILLHFSPQCPQHITQATEKEIEAVYDELMRVSANLIERAKPSGLGIELEEF